MRGGAEGYLTAETLVSADAVERAANDYAEAVRKVYLDLYTAREPDSAPFDLDRAKRTVAQAYVIINRTTDDLAVPARNAIRKGDNDFPPKGSGLHAAMRTAVEELAAAYPDALVFGSSPHRPTDSLGGERATFKRHAAILDHIHHDLEALNFDELRAPDADPGGLKRVMRDSITKVIRRYRDFCIQGYAACFAADSGLSRDLIDSKFSSNSRRALQESGKFEELLKNIDSYKEKVIELKSARARARGAGQETALSVNRRAEEMLRIAFHREDFELYAACAMDIEDSASDILAALRSADGLRAPAAAAADADGPGELPVAAETEAGTPPETAGQKKRRKEKERKQRRREEAAARPAPLPGPEGLPDDEASGGPLEAADDPATAGRPVAAASDVPTLPPEPASAGPGWTTVPAQGAKRMEWLGRKVEANLAWPVGSPRHLEGLAARTAGPLLRGVNVKMKMTSPGLKTIDVELDFVTGHAVVEVTAITGNDVDRNGNRISKRRQFDRFLLPHNNPRGLTWVLMAPNYQNDQDLEYFREKGAIHVRSPDKLEEVLRGLIDRSRAASRGPDL